MDGEESSHFTSVLRIVADPSSSLSYELPSPDAAGYVVSSSENGKLAVISERQQPLLHRSSLTKQSPLFKFDRVYPRSASFHEVYKESVISLVDSMLVGYHSTVLSVGPPSFLAGRPKGLILASAKRIFRMLAKSKMVSTLSVFCSYVLVHEESTYDLLHPTTAQVYLDQERRLEATSREAKGFKAVEMMLKEGEESKKRRVGSDLSHSLFTLRIEYAQFGSMTSPVSGNLTFVNLGDVDAFESTSTTKSRVSTSLQGFTSVVSAVSSSCNENSADATYPPDEDLPGRLSVDFERCVLTRMLREALGGNCKTLLIIQVGEHVPSCDYNACKAALKMGSLARHIVNHPDKTELAKRALMDAYMKELKRMYSSSHILPSRTTAKSTEHPQRADSDDKKNSEQEAEMAAKALATAVKDVKQGIEGDSEESDYDEDDDDNVFLSQSASSDEFMKSMRREARRKIKLTNKMKKGHGSRTSKYSLLDFKESIDGQALIEESAEDLTIDALVAVIQDPDNGVPRPRINLLTNVKFHRGKGDVFSGADIVCWMVKNIVGIENEQDGETLGQILLDKGAIFHSEGSSVFANAESLFYYARDPRLGRKVLTLEEIQALFARNREQVNPGVVHSKHQPSQPPNQPHTVKIQDGQGEEVLEDFLHEKDIAMIPVRSEETPSRANEKVPIVQTVSSTVGSTTKSPANQDQQEESPLGVEPAPLQPNAKGSTKIKLPPLKMQHHLSNKEDGKVNSLSEEFEAHSPTLQKIPSKPADQPQTVAAGVILQSNDELVDSKCGTSVEATDAIGMNPRDTPVNVHCSNQNCVNNTESNPQVPSIAHEGGHHENISKDSRSPGAQAQEAVSPAPAAVVTVAPDVSDISKVPTINSLEGHIDYPHPLHFAAAIGKETGVIKNLVNWYGVNVADDKYRTPLMFAAVGNKASVAKALLEWGGHANVQDEGGLTALHIACYNGSKDVVATLLSHKANVTISDRMQHTILHWAMVPESTSCLKTLLRMITQRLLEQEDISGLTAMHWSIYYNRPEHLKLLTTRFPEVKKLDSSGRTLLTYAIESNSVQCVEVLLRYFPELAVTPDNNGLTPLHHASAQDDKAMAEILLKASPQAKSSQTINVNEQDNFGRTPMHYAALYDRLKTAEILLIKGADRSIQEENGMSPLQFAQNYPGVCISSDMVSLLKSWKPPTSDTTRSKRVGSPNQSTHSEICTLL